MEKEINLLPEEREIAFGGSVADDFYTLDANKCKTYNRIIKTWLAYSEKYPDRAFIQFEDDYHIVFKIHKKYISFPHPKQEKKLSDEQRAVVANRMKKYWSEKENAGQD